MPAHSKTGSGPAARADWSVCATTRSAFIDTVWEQGRARYRDLPWRGIDDAYAVLVSEVMLQQTQVTRVLKYWERWLALFPTVDALASADTATVLEMWQGLGYNRRALALKRACEECAAHRGGQLPATVEELVSLPGIGPATAAGVVAFAYGKPAVYLETNVRSVFLHELFPAAEKVSDKLIAPYVADTCPPAGHEAGPRSWYYALLDYGAYLKTQVANPSRRSSHYARQSAFEGSRRQKRSFVLQQVLACPDGVPLAQVARLLSEAELEAGRAPVDDDTLAGIVRDLEREGFFYREGDLLVP